MKCPGCLKLYKRYPLKKGFHILYKRKNYSESMEKVRCAFKTKEFSGDNWNCQTMGKLRDIVEDKNHYERDDSSAGSFGWLMIPEDFDQRGYLVMSWYKNRGTTAQALVLNEGGVQKLKLKTALKLIKYYSIKK
jgi:hypothetical protein